MVQALIDYLVPPTIVPLQKVWDNFDGDTLDERWTLTETGTGTGAMNDVVDGGWKYTTGTTSSDNGIIEFNSINHYAENACVCIWVGKSEETTNQDTRWGLVNTTGETNKTYWRMDTGSTANYALWTGNNGEGSNLTQSSIAADTNEHKLRVELTSTSAVGHIDDVLEAVRSSELPNVDLEPFFKKQTKTTAAKAAYVRYLEVFNT